MAGLKFLKTNGAPWLGEYLSHLTTAATEARRFKSHVHYTKKMWRATDAAVGVLDVRVVAGYGRLSAGLWAMAGEADVSAFLAGFRGLVGDLLELLRVLQRDCFHSQHLVFGYLKRSLADRAVLGGWVLGGFVDAVDDGVGADGGLCAEDGVGVGGSV